MEKLPCIIEIDTDTGADDASALILAAKDPDIEIEGVTVLARIKKLPCGSFFYTQGAILSSTRDRYLSSISAASFISCIIGRCCGHTRSHCPHPIQSEAFPPLPATPL